MRKIIGVLLASVSLLASAETILNRVDGYREFSDSFYMEMTITILRDGKIRENAGFRGFFKGKEKSLLYCAKGKNRGMKVLMKGDNMWLSLPGSRRSIRITPMQRLMGEASNGDVAKITFSQDYEGEVLEQKQEFYKLLLKAKRRGATYQRAILYVRKKDYAPIKGEFFLLSGKHFKTAYYEKFAMVEGKRVAVRIRIKDEIKKGWETIMEFKNFRKKSFPSKYFNPIYLPRLEVK